MKKLFLIPIMLVPHCAYPMETKLNHEQLVKLLRDKDKNIEVLDKYCQEHTPRVCQKLGEPVYNKVLAAWTEEEKRELFMVFTKHTHDDR